MQASRSAPYRLLGLQLTLIVGALAALGLYPPVNGRMLLVPLWPGAEAGMIARATRGGALLVGNGPTPHSFVVLGSRAALAPAMLPHGVLLVAAPPAGCGAGAAA